VTRRKNTNKYTYDAVDAGTADMARDHAGQAHAKRNECSRRFKHCHHEEREIIGQTSKIAVEQQSNATLAVAANMQGHLALSRHSTSRHCIKLLGFLVWSEAISP
jgi:hypothetical protein